MKKKEYKSKGIKLIVKDIKKKSILTTQGKLTFLRKILRTNSKEDEDKLVNKFGIKSIVPLDNYLKINSIPFKLSPKFMLEIAHWAIKCDSFKEAQDIIFKIYNQKINHETIRNVTYLIGKLVYEYDCEKAEEAINLFKNNCINFKDEFDEIVYIQMYGSFINTRQKDKNGSSWTENKLCIIFKSNDLLIYRNKEDEISYKANKAEYISLLDSVEEFKKHVLASVLKNKYNLYKNVVIISDGTPWIKNIKEEFFPNAQQILNIYHLHENTSNFLKAVLKDEDKINYYYDKWNELFDQGVWRKVLKDLEKFKDKKLPDGVVNLYKYILDNENNLNYPIFKLKYNFVGSGTIESGNNHVVLSRLRLSGMKWSKIFAQYITSLLCKEYSGEWNIVEDIVRSNFSR